MAASEWLVVTKGGDAGRVVPVLGRLTVGRECAGVDPNRRLVLDDPSISRDHFEVRLDPARGALLFDFSTNGTRVNDRRVERDEPIALADGDIVRISQVELRFRTLARPSTVPEEVRSTIRTVSATRLAGVVGDVIGYTALTERHGGRAVATALDVVFGCLRELLGDHGGTVSNYAGDALFAAWDAGEDAGPAAARAVSYALAAEQAVAREAARLSLREADGGPLRMGWGVTLGEIAAGRPSPAREAIHGDAVNLAFRLAGIAGRDGRAPVLVSRDAAAAAPGAARYGPLEELRVRGRNAPAQVHPATAPA